MSDAGIRAANRFELTDAVEQLRRRIPWLVLGLSIGLLVGFVALRILPASYRSEATLLVESPWFPQEFVQNPLGKSMRERLQTLQHRLTSDSALNAIATEVGPERFGARSQASRDAVIRAGFQFELIDAASPEAAVIRVAYVAPDPELARDVVRAVAHYAVEERRQEGADQAAATADVLREELEEVGQGLAAKAEQLARLGSRSAPAESGTQGAEGRAARLAELRALEAEVARAETRYTARHPQLLQLRAELQRALRSAPGGGARHPAAGAEASAEYRSLLQEYESSLKTYESLLGRRIDAAMAERLGRNGVFPEIRVLREAELSRRPVAPDPLLFLAGGGAGGLALAALLALLPALRRPTFSGVDQLAEASGLPVVAVLPELPAMQEAGASAGWRALVDPESAPGEQFRRILPHLSRASGTPVVLLAAAERGAGTSWCAANLAAIAASDGQRRTLLIDTDLRSPSLHTLLGIPPGPGLAECVRGDHSLSSASLPTSLPNLFLLRAGDATGSSLAAFQDERLLKLVDDARREFGVVFLDAPPRMTVVDAALVERLATLVLLVVRADRTPRASVLRALRGVELPVGLILNGVHAVAYRRHFGEDPARPPYPRAGHGR